MQPFRTLQHVAVLGALACCSGAAACSSAFDGRAELESQPLVGGAAIPRNELREVLYDGTCGYTVVGTNALLTAAHCVWDLRAVHSGFVRDPQTTDEYILSAIRVFTNRRGRFAYRVAPRGIEPVGADADDLFEAEIERTFVPDDYKELLRLTRLPTAPIPDDLEDRDIALLQVRWRDKPPPEPAQIETGPLSVAQPIAITGCAPDSLATDLPCATDEAAPLGERETACRYSNGKTGPVKRPVDDWLDELTRDPDAVPNDLLTEYVFYAQSPPANPERTDSGSPVFDGHYVVGSPNRLPIVGVLRRGLVPPKPSMGMATATSGETGTWLRRMARDNTLDVRFAD